MLFFFCVCVFFFFCDYVFNVFLLWKFCFLFNLVLLRLKVIFGALGLAI